MLKGEIEILAAILLNKSAGRQISTGRLARYSPFIIVTLESLKKKRYIVPHKTKGYVITEKGVRVLAEFSPEYSNLGKIVFTGLLRKQVEETGKAIRMIEQICSDYDNRVNGS